VDEMIEPAGSPSTAPLNVLLRGEAGVLTAWTTHWRWLRVAQHLAFIVVGAGLYGAAMGWWRAPEQALYVAIKLPLIVVLTTVGNALLNAMLAPLLGLDVTFRQSLLAVLMSFAIAATILGAFAPIVGFLVWNAPPMSPEEIDGATYSLIKLTHVVAIAFAGVAGNLRLLQLLAHLGGNRAVARRVLCAWLAGNLFFGSQLAWIMRPFIGAPYLPVVFVRHDVAFQGNFYENVIRSAAGIVGNQQQSEADHD
jgi:hypothetical protein